MELSKILTKEKGFKHSKDHPTIIIKMKLDASKLRIVYNINYMQRNSGMERKKSHNNSLTRVKVSSRGINKWNRIRFLECI